MGNDKNTDTNRKTETMIDQKSALTRNEREEWIALNHITRKLTRAELTRRNELNRRMLKNSRYTPSPEQRKINAYYREYGSDKLGRM